MWFKRNNWNCKNLLPLFQVLLENNKRRFKKYKMGNKFEKTVMNEGAEGLLYAQELKETYPWIKIVPWVLFLLIVGGCIALMT